MQKKLPLNYSFVHIEKSLTSVDRYISRSKQEFNKACQQIYIGIMSWCWLMGANNEGANVEVLITVVVQHPFSLRKRNNQ